MPTWHTLCRLVIHEAVWYWYSRAVGAKGTIRSQAGQLALYLLVKMATDT